MGVAAWLFSCKERQEEVVDPSNSWRNIRCWVDKARDAVASSLQVCSKVFKERRRREEGRKGGRNEGREE